MKPGASKRATRFYDGDIIGPRRERSGQRGSYMWRGGNGRVETGCMGQMFESCAVRV